MSILINIAMFVVFVIGIIGAVTVIEVEIEKRKRDVTKDEQEFLDWMKEIPTLNSEKEITNHMRWGYVRRWCIELVKEISSISIVDRKYDNSISIKKSGEVRGLYSVDITIYEKDDNVPIIYDFKSTNKISEFKQIYEDIVTTLEIQKETKEEEFRSKRGPDIIQKMRTG